MTAWGNVKICSAMQECSTRNYMLVVFRDFYLIYLFLDAHKINEKLSSETDRKIATIIAEVYRPCGLKFR